MGKLKIGLVNIYSFRPHVEHLYYLATLLQSAGHDVEFLTCDSSVSDCYPRLLRKSSRIVECSKCVIGGIRSYTSKNVSSISKMKKRGFNLSSDDLGLLTLSSSCTLNRTESDNEWNSEEVKDIRNKLSEPVSVVASATAKWIEEKRIDGVICFNGRMDLT